jgi:hypothetical protein
MIAMAVELQLGRPGDSESSPVPAKPGCALMAAGDGAAPFKLVLFY